MKRILLVAVWLFIHTYAYQQIPTGEGTSSVIFNGHGDFKNLSASVNMAVALQNQNGVKIPGNKRVEGSPFFSQDWHWGYIRFDNGVIFDSIRLRYNSLNNELHFLDKETEYFLKDYYREFGYTETGKDGILKIVFRNSFPPLDKNNRKTNYQLLAGNGYLLLKLMKKELGEVAGLDGQSYYKFIESAFYYVYNSADSSLIKVRKGVELLQTDLPELKEQILTICAKEKLKCKSESDLIVLFSKIGLQQNEVK